MFVLPRPSVRHVWMALTLSLPFILPLVGSMVIVDLGWTIRAGQWMAEERRLLLVDPFTSAPPAEVQVNQQWLAQILYFALHTVGGFELVALMGGVSAAVSMGLVLATCMAGTTARVRLSCAATTVAIALAASNLGARPQTLAYPLFAFFLLTWARDEARGRTRLWLATPPLMALWANLHGSFVLGLVLLSAIVIGRLLEYRASCSLWPVKLGPARAPLLALAACLGAASLTPYGAGSLAYVLRLGSNPIVRDFLTEWAPTGADSREGMLFFVSLALVGALLLWGRARPTPTEWLLLLAFGGLAASSLRAIVWWGFIVAPIAARLLADRFPAAPGPPATGRPALNAAILVIVGIVAFLNLPWLRPLHTFLPAERRSFISLENPAAAAAYLRSHPPAPGVSDTLFAESTWGGYLDLTVWPTYRPFLDTRAELHPPDVWLDYLYTTFPGADWQEILDRYDLESMLLSVDRTPDLIEAVERSSAWRLAYRDDQAVLFERWRPDAPSGAAPPGKS